jgi:hypothetical protein
VPPPVPDWAHEPKLLGRPDPPHELDVSPVVLVVSVFVVVVDCRLDVVVVVPDFDPLPPRPAGVALVVVPVVVPVPA